MPYEIGEEEFIGADDVEALLSGYEIGARRPVQRTMQRNAAMRQALAARQANAGLLLRQSQPTKARAYAVPFDSVSTVPAGATSTISVQPQCLFRGERLVLGSTSAAGFLILDLKVGKNSQFAASGAHPGEAFGPTAFGVDLKCDTAQISNTVSIQVQNITGGALRFNATFFGSTVE